MGKPSPPQQPLSKIYQTSAPISTSSAPFQNMAKIQGINHCLLNYPMRLKVATKVQKLVFNLCMTPYLNGKSIESLFAVPFCPSLHYLDTYTGVLELWCVSLTFYGTYMVAKSSANSCIDSPMYINAHTWPKNYTF